LEKIESPLIPPACGRQAFGKGDNMGAKIDLSPLEKGD